VHPAASAADTFHDAMVTGAFHGTMAPTTPTGSSVTRPARPSGVLTYRSRPGCAAGRRSTGTPGATRPVWARDDWLMAHPISSTVMPAMSSAARREELGGPVEHVGPLGRREARPGRRR
jgi:hypothetical protein